MSKSISASGSRKQAIARATLTAGKGKVVVNGKDITSYPEMVKLKMMTPLLLAGEYAKKVDILVRVHGGGITGQADAVSLAIANALVESNKKLEKTFLDYDRRLLVADVRRKEVRKPNRHGKARAKRQKSYR